MPVDPVKIPQNVYVEDRIVGPLTLRQIIIIAIGGGFSYMLYALVQKSLGHVGIPLTILLWTPAAISAAFALVNINDLSLLRICFLLLERVQKPAQRTWGPRRGIGITIRTSAKPEEAPAMANATQKSTQQQIAELTPVLDRPTAPASSPTPAATMTSDVSMPMSVPAAASGAVPAIDSVTAPSSSAATAATATAADVPSAVVESAARASAPTPSPRPPVDPSRIRADAVTPPAEGPELSRRAEGPASASSARHRDEPSRREPPHLSDLSVFRDVFPPTASWQA